MYYKDAQTFQEENGYTIDGTWYPRVTKIVGIKAKPALYRFYAGVSDFAEGERIKEQSATEGTLVHEVAEKILRGEPVEVPEGIKPAINAFSDFVSRHGIAVSGDHIERRILHPKHGYAGTCDALATIGGKFGVLDIKTSVAIYRDYNLQTAAYYYALRPDFPALATRWILRVDQTRPCLVCGAKLRSKGGREKTRRSREMAACKEKEHEWGDMTGEVELKELFSPAPDFRAFLAAKMLWEWENHFWLSRIGYPMLLTQ